MYQPKIKIFDKIRMFAFVERLINFIKYLGMLIDKILSWKYILTILLLK